MNKQIKAMFTLAFIFLSSFNLEARRGGGGGRGGRGNWSRGGGGRWHGGGRGYGRRGYYGGRGWRRGYGDWGWGVGLGLGLGWYPWYYGYNSPSSTTYVYDTDTQYIPVESQVDNYIYTDGSNHFVQDPNGNLIQLDTFRDENNRLFAKSPHTNQTREISSSEIRQIQTT